MKNIILFLLLHLSLWVHGQTCFEVLKNDFKAADATQDFKNFVGSDPDALYIYASLSTASKSVRTDINVLQFYKKLINSNLDAFGTQLIQKLDDAKLKSFADDFKNADVADLNKLAANNGELVDSWTAIKNAPDAVKRNITVLGKVDELFTAGFKQVDIDVLTGVLNKLKGRSIPDADLEKIAEYALEARKHTGQYANLNIETDLFKQIDELASSSKFKNPEDLKVFLSETQLLQNIADNPGNLEALNEAVRVLKNRDEVLLEGKGALKGDIVNVTKTESIQYKAFTGAGNSTTTTNLKKAAEQFISETPASGYKKIAKLKVLDSGNPQFNSSTIELKNRFQQYLNQNLSNTTGDNLRALTEIRVDNAVGLSRFEIINNVVTIIP